MKLLLLLVLNTLFIACAQQTAISSLTLSPAPLPVSARFITVRTHGQPRAADTQQREWLFWRNRDRIEINVPERQRGEAWLRDGNTYFYQKLFHADRKIVEYAKEDLQALNISMSWRTNELMIDPRVLQRLTIKDRNTVDGHPALVLQDRLEGIDYEVVWLADVDLPYRLTKQDAKGEREETRLIDVQSLEQARSQPPDSQGYEVLDYADIGDRERDPFVMKVQHELPGEETHTHSH